MAIRTPWVHDGGGVYSRWYIEGDRLVREQRQPGQDAILKRNAELRKNPDALNHLSFAGLELSIPDLDYVGLVKKYPDLDSKDAHTKRNAWLKFMGSAEADPYRVRDRQKTRGGQAIST